jgi:hypothetical protein
MKLDSGILYGLSWRVDLIRSDTKILEFELTDFGRTILSWDTASINSYSPHLHIYVPTLRDFFRSVSILDVNQLLTWHNCLEVSHRGCDRGLAVAE